jgi:hypothetical protein
MKNIISLNAELRRLEQRVAALRSELDALTAALPESAQDAVGTILTDTATIDFTYNDAVGPTITADVKTDSITNTLLANMAQTTVKGRAAAAGTGDPTDLTAVQLVAILATADGAGSGLDADLLDGLSSAAFATAVHAHAGEDITSGTVADARIASTITRDSEVFGIVLAADGSGSGLDADLLDGNSSAAFPLLAGRAGGQSLTGGTGASETLTLLSTSHGTKGKVILGAGGTTAYDSVNDRLGVGTATPLAKIHAGAGADTPTIVSTTILAANAADTAITARDTDENIETFMFAGSGLGLMGTATTHPLHFRTDNANRMTILSDGKVGVANTSPGYPLHVGAGADTLVRTATTLAVQVAGSAEITARDATNDVEMTIIAASSGGFFGTPTSHNLTVLANNATVARFYVGGSFGILDGITAPATAAGIAQIYVDTADGDLKVKFGDGTVKTLATDT